MVVFTLITEAYNKVDLGEGRWKRKYEVVEPNEDFDTTDFASRFRGFEDACRLREIVGESNKDLLKKLFEKLLEEEIIQRLNSLRRQQKAYCLNHYLRLYIHPIIPSLTNITNTLLMEGRKV
ncbi:hypothetical protein Avbf_12894, partial [Armadillidium vulgare]